MFCTRNIIVLICFLPLLAMGEPDYTKPQIQLLDSLVSKSIGFYQEKQLEASKQKSVELLELATKQNAPYYQVKANRLLALIHEAELNYKAAFEDYESALKITRQHNLYEEEIITLKKISQLFGAQQNYPRGLSYAFTALRIADSIGSQEAIIDMNVLITNSLVRQNELGKAQKYLLQAELVNEELQDPKRASEIAWTYGNLYNGLEDFDSAIEAFESAIEYHEENENIPSLISTYSNIGQILTKKGNALSLGKATTYLNKSLVLAIETEDQENVIRNLTSLAENEIAQGNYTRALSLLNRATEENRELSNLNFNYYIQKSLSVTQEKLGNEKAAYAAFKQFKIIQDSLYNLERDRLVNQIESRYSYEEEVREKQAAQLKFQQQKNVNTILWAIAAALLLVAFGIVYYFRLRRRNELLVIERQKLIQTQKINELESEAEIRAINAMLDGREKERQAIAETLHDSVSTLLSSANMHLQAFKQNINGHKVAIDKTQNIITEAAEKVRFLSHELMSSVLAKFGLEAAIQDLAEKFTTENLEFITEVNNLDQRLPWELENKIYHIIEELCNNIIKHSNASEATIGLTKEMNTLYISVKDNGKGFPGKLDPEKAGMGISQIRARVKGMSGYINIQSEEGEFTLINISLPLAATAKSIK